MSNRFESMGASISRGKSERSELRGKNEDAESKSSGGSVSNTSEAKKKDPTLQLGAQETRNVRNSKVCVYMFLILMTVVFSLATWAFISGVEQLALAQQFDLFAQGILAVSTINALNTFALFEAEALQLTTHAITTGQKWPFFKLAMFEVEGDLLYNQTKTGDYIAIHPLVTADQRPEWEQYVAENQDWIQDAYRYHGVEGTRSPICPYISDSFSNCTPAPYNSSRTLYAPAWQVHPVVGRENDVNYDGLSTEPSIRTFQKMSEARRVTIGAPLNFDGSASNFLSYLMTPVFEDIHSNSNIVAVLVGLIPWNDYFSNLLPDGVDGIHVVVTSEWEDFTFKIDGPLASYLGPGDLHDPKYDSFLKSNEFAGSSNGTSGLGFTVNVYPTLEFEEAYTGNAPIVYSIAVACVFLFAISVFFVYDLFVERRQTKVMLTATKSSAIVDSLFPANVRDRLMEEQNAGNHNEKDRRMTAFKTLGRETLPSSKPIADLFPATTVMFADIAGFTAWSSVREPSQVFVLLESFYNAFDKIAKKMKVFKVETIGDSYVAVAGLPDPRNDHAEVMARFAHKCLMKMNTLSHKLETILGPGTSDLKMRVGLHSGSVTAGVLRGEKSRFQLFGDTVNTAARMESTGIKNRIQLSQETADLIIAAGKEHWVKPRANKVFAKGKGELQTYWFVQGTDSDVTESTEEGTSASILGDNLDPVTSYAVEPHPHRAGTERLILWNVENLSVPLKKLVASRQGQKLPSLKSWRKLEFRSQQIIRPNNIAMDEVEEFLTLPETRVGDQGMVAESGVLDEVVMDQLTNYVATICSLYRPHAFHNFDHASHVAQSVTKLLSSWILTSDHLSYERVTLTPQAAAPEKLHDFIYGISSHPFVQFAVILSALIHDVDHPGVPNSTLVKEGAEMAIDYKNKSVAEQNSVDIAWGLLMEAQYEELRRCIYTTQAELESFRKLIVNVVLATDVMDKELGNLRQRRWDLAFQKDASDASLDDKGSVATNRKATIVIEYLMQASDVAHTMQHWHIYTLWNEKFFQECYKAFEDGRSDRDPTEGWYDGELAFFDYYVIPLAKRLKECGVFGVCSDEHLNYAVSNREEWSRRGKEMVSLYLERSGKPASTMTLDL